MAANPSNPRYVMPFDVQFDAARAQEWIISRLLRKVHTAELVSVLAVRPDKDTVGFLDVQPLVLDQDTNGFIIDQSPIYNVPYLRMQGGPSAVILDPVVGDMGLCVFAFRDMTTVVKTRKPAMSPTDRRHSTADALYLGGFLNGVPKQWVKFIQTGDNPLGIDIYTPGNLTLSASNLVIKGPTEFTDTVKAPDVRLPNGSVNNHTHYVPAAPGDSDSMKG